MQQALYPYFGSGKDGNASLSGTHAPIDASCYGTASSNTLNATNASFAANQIILIIQSRGTGVGQWEINRIVSYTTGVITTLLPLAYTYTDSGNSQAQVIVIPEYHNLTISSTFTAKAWDGNVGGVIPLFASGLTNITSTLSAAEKGYIGGQINSFGEGKQGEGTVGPGGTVSRLKNGSGGGGNEYDASYLSGAGGGGHAAAGTAGQTINSAQGGEGGTTSGNAALTSITFGGSGGGGDNISSGGRAIGGNGGGIILLFTNTLSVTGAINVDGEDGEDAISPGQHGGAGGGAGGSILIRTMSANIGTNKLTAAAGTGGNDYGGGGNGGAGSVGRIHIDIFDTDNLTGTSSPSADIDTLSIEQGGMIDLL